MTWLADNWLVIIAILAFAGVHLLMHRGHGSHLGTGHAGHGAPRPAVPPVPIPRGPGPQTAPLGATPALGGAGLTTMDGSRASKGHSH